MDSEPDYSTDGNTDDSTESDSSDGEDDEKKLEDQVWKLRTEIRRLEELVQVFPERSEEAEMINHKLSGYQIDLDRKIKLLVYWCSMIKRCENGILYRCVS